MNIFAFSVKKYKNILKTSLNCPKIITFTEFFSIPYKKAFFSTIFSILIFRHIFNNDEIKGLLLLVALLAWVQGAFANDDVFEYDENDSTIISGLVWGANPESLTIPASVKTVEEGAFACATNLEKLYIDGGDPYFHPNAFELDGDVGGRKLSYLNLGSGMSTNNILGLIKTIGKGNKLTQIDIDGFIGEFDPDEWDKNAMGDYLSSDVIVSLPAELVDDQEFGYAQVYGHFSLEHDLVTFCGKQSFTDIDNPNWVIYVPTHLENGSVYIKRVPYIYGNEGVLLHYAEGMSNEAYLPRNLTLEGSYESNMLVGVTVPTMIDETDGDKTNFVLYEGKFYPTSGGTLGANRAYLQVPTSEVGNLSNLTIIYEEEEDGIIQLRREETAAQRAGWYTLGGQRISQPQQAGIYVHNGRLETVK